MYGNFRRCCQNSCASAYRCQGVGETQLFAKWLMRRVKQEWKTAERTQHTDAFLFLKTFNKLTL